MDLLAGTMNGVDEMCRLANLESRLLEYDRKISRLDERLLALDVKYQQMNISMKKQPRHTLSPGVFDAEFKECSE